MDEKDAPEATVLLTNTTRAFEPLDCHSVGALWTADPAVLARHLPEGLTSRCATVFSFTVACARFVVDGADSGSGAMHVVGTEVEPVVAGDDGDEHAFLFDQIFHDDAAARWWQTAGFPATIGSAANEVVLDATIGTMQASSPNGNIELTRQHLFSRRRGTAEEASGRSSSCRGTR